jgi:hypothetical protein
MCPHRQAHLVVVARRSSSICLPLTIRKQDLDARNYHSQAFSHRIEYVDVCRFG